MITRRDALKKLGAAAGAAGAAALGCGRSGGAEAAGGSAARGSTARDASGPSAGSDSPAAAGAAATPSRLGPLGVQLYTLREEMQRDTAATLMRVAEIGYEEVEFAGYFGQAPATVRDMLAAAGLRAPSAHVPVQLLATEPGPVFEAASNIGHEYVVIASIPTDMRATLDDWRRTGELFHRIGDQARAAGLRFAYHNHDFEFRLTEGRVGMEVLCESTDPALVHLELDLFWITHGGGDPLAFIQRWPGRITMVHVKDRTAAGRMVDVGAGAIDWRSIFARREQAGIRHYFVEHDQPGDAFASVTASFRYLATLEV